MTEHGGHGVQEVEGGWGWRCECGATATTPVSREEARDDYREHRKQQHAPQAAETSREEVTMSDATKTDGEGGTATKKSAVKKAATKKAPAAKKAATKKAPAAKKAAAARKNGSGRTFRFGVVKNPKTQREVFPWVNADGQMAPRRAKRMGVERTVAKYGEIAAPSRKEAMARMRDGKVDKWVTTKK